MEDTRLLQKTKVKR